MYTTGSDIRFKITILMSSLCDYGDGYILVKGRIRITGNEGPQEGRTDAQLLAEKHAGGRDKGVIFKNCAPFINCQNEINNTEIDNA